MSKPQLIKSLLVLLFILAFFFPAKAVAEVKKDAIYLFWGQGCPHCAQVNMLFEEKGYNNKYPIEKREVYNNKTNANLLNEYFEKYHVPLDNRGVPAIFIGERYLIGGTDIPNQFESLANEFTKSKPSEIKPEATTSPVKATSSPSVNLLLPAVVAGALADSVNPCEFAVLILLLTAILASGSPKRALKAGLLFSLAIFISYLLMGLGLYKALAWGNLPRFFLIGIGVLAIVLGLFNMKDYFWYGKGGFLMEVPMSWRPQLKSLIFSVTSPAGAFFIGFLVSLFLLPCTSGPYIIILGMLSQRTLFVQALGYLILYNIIFILPMVLITLAIYKGFNLQRAEEFRQKRLRLFHLIIGLLLIGMGGVVLAGWI
jgi:cytochrome c biogenesis protein CcdA/glutaredoxin